MATGLLPALYVQRQVGVGCPPAPGPACLPGLQPCHTQACPTELSAASIDCGGLKTPVQGCFQFRAEEAGLPLTFCFFPHSTPALLPYPQARFIGSLVTLCFSSLQAGGSSSQWLHLLCSLSSLPPAHFQGDHNSLFSDQETHRLGILYAELSSVPRHR